MFVEDILEKLVGTTILSAEVKDGGGLVPDEIRITTIDDDVFVISISYLPVSLRMEMIPYEEGL